MQQSTVASVLVLNILEEPQINLSPEAAVMEHDSKSYPIPSQRGMIIMCCWDRTLTWLQCSTPEWDCRISSFTWTGLWIPWACAMDWEGQPCWIKWMSWMAMLKAGAISMGVIVLLLLVAVTMYGLYMRKKTKPSWWLKFLRNDHRDMLLIAK